MRLNRLSGVKLDLGFRRIEEDVGPLLELVGLDFGEGAGQARELLELLEGEVSHSFALKRSFN